LVAFLVCLVATIVPALYAARLRPAEGMRDQ
jgi:ABC-type lipoprotein release transport system permease subunit